MHSRRAGQPVHVEERDDRIEVRVLRPLPNSASGSEASPGCERARQADRARSGTSAANTLRQRETELNAANAELARQVRELEHAKQVARRAKQCRPGLGWTWLAVQLPWDDVPSLGFWSQPVFPLELARSVFFVRLLLVLRIAQWEEMKKLR